jgi:lipoprotein-anchoring transpeptidase ErfK/SrfK
MSESPVDPRDPGARRLGALPIIAISVAVLLILLLAGAYAYDQSRSDVIAKGVKVAGVDVGGLDRAAAQKKVEAQLTQRLGSGVTVTAGSQHWTLNARGAALKINFANMVSQAVDVSREGSFLSRSAREVFGGSVNRDIALVDTYSHTAVHGLIAKVKAAVNRAPVNATVQPGPSGLSSVPSQDGIAVDGSALGARVDAALIGVSQTRTIHVPAHHTKPAITTANLAAKYPGYIVVDRATFKLTFYSHLKLSKTYEVAVGMEGLETPAGLHHIEWEQVDPPWYVPKKAWAGALAGTVVPPGPGDPLKARFMSIEGGAGIHGIDPSEYSSIGHNASHGCVRMRIPDVISLYAVSPVGTPVYII